MSRFRPTSFRVAFGNVSEDEPQAMSPPLPPPIPTPTPELLSTPEIRRIQVAEENVGFERIIVRATPCQRCRCGQCNYSHRIHEQKLNILLFLVFMIFVMLLVMAFKKSD